MASYSWADKFPLALAITCLALQQCTGQVSNGTITGDVLDDADEYNFDWASTLNNMTEQSNEVSNDAGGAGLPEPVAGNTSSSGYTTYNHQYV